MQVDKFNQIIILYLIECTYLYSRHDGCLERESTNYTVYKARLLMIALLMVIRQKTST